MSSVPPPHRPFVLKTSRDTLMLLAAAGAMTLALAYSVHNRPAPDASQGQTTDQAAAGEWAGQLAELTPNQAIASAPAETLSSAALTIPSAAMALPVAPKSAVAKPRPCEGTACPTVAKLATVPVPARRAVASAAPASSKPVREASLLTRLNPLNRLPDMVKRPFASAGDTIAGWVSRF